MAPRVVLLLFAITWHVESAASEWTPYVSLDSLSYSEPVSVYASFNEFNGGLDDGEIAFTHNQAEAGARRGPWTVAVVTRYDYDLSFTNAAADLLYRGENDLPVDADSNYPLTVHANHLAASGLKLGYAWQASDALRLEGAVTYLVGRQMLEGSVRGEIVTDSSSSFTGNLDANYRYSEDVLLDRRVSEPSGQGYTIDLHAHWAINTKLNMSLSVYDAHSAVYWDNAPYTDARVTSATVDFDENGFIETTPLLTGVEGNKKFKQTLAVRTRTKVEYTLDDGWGLAAEHYNQNSTNFARVGFTKLIQHDGRWGFFYDAQTHAMLFSAQKRWFQFTLGLDDFDYRKANYLQLGLRLHIAL